MLNKIAYILILISLSFSYPQVNNSTKESKIDTIKLIITLSSFHNAKEQDARAIATILAEHIKGAYNLTNKHFEVETPSSLSDIEKTAGDNFDHIILTADEYLALEKKMPLEPYITNFTNGHIGFKFHLIVNTANNIDDISQLKGGTISILSPGNQQTAVYWLDKLLKDKKLQNHNKFFKETKKESKATNVLLPVYFNKIEACIVTDVSLKLMLELNPAIKSKIKILNSSDYYILGIGCMNKKKRNTDNYKLLKKIIPDLHNNEYGKQLLNLFSAEKLVPFNNDYLKAYNNLLHKIH